jgi:hypothetical protein
VLPAGKYLLQENEGLYDLKIIGFFIQERRN